MTETQDFDYDDNKASIERLHEAQDGDRLKLEFENGDITYLTVIDTTVHPRFEVVAEDEDDDIAFIRRKESGEGLNRDAYTEYCVDGQENVQVKIEKVIRSQNIEF